MANSAWVYGFHLRIPFEADAGPSRQASHRVGRPALQQGIALRVQRKLPRVDAEALRRQGLPERGQGLLQVGAVLAANVGELGDAHRSVLRTLEGPGLRWHDGPSVAVEQEGVAQDLLQIRSQRFHQAGEVTVEPSIAGASRSSAAGAGDGVAASLACRLGRVRARVEQQDEARRRRHRRHRGAPGGLGPAGLLPAKERDPPVTGGQDIGGEAAQAEGTLRGGDGQQDGHRGQADARRQADGRDQSGETSAFSQAQERQQRQRQGDQAPGQAPAGDGHAGQPMDAGRERRVPDRGTVGGGAKRAERHASLAHQHQLAPEKHREQSGKGAQAGETCQRARRHRIRPAGRRGALARSLRLLVFPLAHPFSLVLWAC